MPVSLPSSESLWEDKGVDLSVGGMRVRFRVCVRGVCMKDGSADDTDHSKHGLLEALVEGRVDRKSERPASDSEGLVDDPEIWVMKQVHW